MREEGQEAVVPAIADIPLGSLPLHVRRFLSEVDRVLIYHLPLMTIFRGVTSREGILLHGEAGWAEAAPFWNYTPSQCLPWLNSAITGATQKAPPPLRERIPVNVTIPVCPPDEAYRRVVDSGGCATAKVKVADPRVTHAADCERIEAVAAALAATVGTQQARIRVDVNAAWTLDEAIRSLAHFNDAAHQIGGLEYAEQPCATVDELAQLRRRQNVPIAADESIRLASDPLEVLRKEAADVVVLKVAPLGGIEATVALAADFGLPAVISSALETSIGLAAGVRAASCLRYPADGTPLACGLATMQLLAADVTVNGLRVEDGHIAVRPIEVDENYIDAQPLPDGILCRWLERLDAICEYSKGEGQ
ncbi:o-succinylbenzoate synthase [Schaalia suimastitidis]|uniref:o-succinylbenzoate synthase n=1 Tax=Schaalia suimastitidis TaxID=121163 RepID=UPI000417D869|nr:o-succinylbenzoate synthase [Schaalia suimastitidis]